jgi:hypothetical protein
MIASESSRASNSAATVAAGAVFRPSGSSTIARAVMPISRSCSAIRKRCSSLQTMSGGAKLSPPTRSIVSCNMLRLETSGSSCFGRSARDNGQSRVPAPPDRMTG